MREVLGRPEALRGARDMMVFAPGLAAWGLVTGIAMVNSGLSTPVALLMSLLVYAGSAQLATIPLLAAGAPIPGWLLRALKVAPLAALTSVIVPEIVRRQGHFAQTWQDARFPAVAAATLYYRWRPGVLGTMLAGLALYLPLRIFCGR